MPGSRNGPQGPFSFSESRKTSLTVGRGPACRLALIIRSVAGLFLGLAARSFWILLNEPRLLGAGGGKHFFMGAICAKRTVLDLGALDIHDQSILAKWPVEVEVNLVELNDANFVDSFANHVVVISADIALGLFLSRWHLQNGRRSPRGSDRLGACRGWPTGIGRACPAVGPDAGRRSDAKGFGGWHQPC